MKYEYRAERTLAHQPGPEWRLCQILQETPIARAEYIWERAVDVDRDMARAQERAQGTRSNGSAFE